MMTMFRVLLSATCLGIFVSQASGRRLQTAGRSGSRPDSACRLQPVACSLAFLPPIVRERLVGLGHPVRVFALLYGAAPEVGRVEQLVRQPLLHRLAVAARAGVAHEPADAERQ